MWHYNFHGLLFLLKVQVWMLFHRFPFCIIIGGVKSSVRGIYIKFLKIAPPQILIIPQYLLQVL